MKALGMRGDVSMCSHVYENVWESGNVKKWPKDGKKNLLKR